MIRLQAGTYYSPSEYADKAGLSTQAVYNAIWQGRLKSYKIGNTHLIKSDALIINRRITHGKYIGIKALYAGDIKKFARLRGLDIDTSGMD